MWQDEKGVWHFNEPVETKEMPMWLNLPLRVPAKDVLVMATTQLTHMVRETASGLDRWCR